MMAKFFNFSECTCRHKKSDWRTKPKTHKHLHKTRWQDIFMDFKIQESKDKAVTEYLHGLSLCAGESKGKQEKCDPLWSQESPSTAKKHALKIQQDKLKATLKSSFAQSNSRSLLRFKVLKQCSTWVFFKLSQESLPGEWPTIRRNWQNGIRSERQRDAKEKEREGEGPGKSRQEPKKKVALSVNTILTENNRSRVKLEKLSWITPLLKDNER